MSQTENNGQQAQSHSDSKPGMSAGAWLFRREVIGLALSAAALLTAVAVGAQTTDGQGQAPIDEATARGLVTTSANLIGQIKGMFEKAEKAVSSNASSASGRTRECVGEVYQEMRNSYKLAQQYAVDVEIAGGKDLKEAENAAAVEKAYAKLSSVFEAFVSLDSKLNGCGGSAGTTAIDGAATVEKTNASTTTTNPTGGGNSAQNTLSDLTVSAENSKVGSPEALGDNTEKKP